MAFKLLIFTLNGFLLLLSLTPICEAIFNVVKNTVRKYVLEFIEEHCLGSD